MDGIDPAYYKEYTLPAGADPETMADGYWVDPGTNSIGSVSVLKGTWSEIPLPTPGSKPSAISWGPGSTLWIAEAGAHRVARFNPNSNSIVEYATADVLTSLATADEEFLLAATDAAGNIEYFDNIGKETTFVTGSAGPATQIGGGIDDFPYLCPTCTVGIQDFLF
jgi:streptogramin lyase